MTVCLAFWVLFLETCRRRAADGRRWLGARNGHEWLLDLSGLLMQGVAVPFLQGVGLYLTLGAMVPGWKGCLDLSAPVAFLLNFVVIDYAYYWNHRLLHRGALWRWHAVHHTAREMDVLVTSRNTLWTPFLIVYVWLNALGIFLLKDPTSFLVSASLTAALDLWRHSEVRPGTAGLPGRVYRALSVALITPETHGWHHSSERRDCNFGANLTLWDRIHGTYTAPAERPSRFGIETEMSPLRQWLLPVGP